MSFTVDEGNSVGCAASELTTYGQNTVASMGPPTNAATA